MPDVYKKDRFILAMAEGRVEDVLRKISKYHKEITVDDIMAGFDALTEYPSFFPSDEQQRILDLIKNHQQHIAKFNEGWFVENMPPVDQMGAIGQLFQDPGRFLKVHHQKLKVDKLVRLLSADRNRKIGRNFISDREYDPYNHGEFLRDVAKAYPTEVLIEATRAVCRYLFVSDRDRKDALCEYINASNDGAFISVLLNAHPDWLGDLLRRIPRDKVLRFAEHNSTHLQPKEILSAELIALEGPITPKAAIEKFPTNREIIEAAIAKQHDVLRHVSMDTLSSVLAAYAEEIESSVESATEVLAKKSLGEVPIMHEPANQDYIYIDENNVVHLLPPIMVGESIGVHNTCQSALGLRVFLKSAEGMLTQYINALNTDIGALERAELQQTALLQQKTSRLRQLENYKLIYEHMTSDRITDRTWRHEANNVRGGMYPTLPSAMQKALQRRDNVLSVLLAPKVEDTYLGGMGTPVFSLKRGHPAGCLSEVLFSAISGASIKKLSPREVMLSCLKEHYSAEQLRGSFDASGVTLDGLKQTLITIFRSKLNVTISLDEPEKKMPDYELLDQKYLEDIGSVNFDEDNIEFIADRLLAAKGDQLIYDTHEKDAFTQLSKTDEYHKAIQLLLAEVGIFCYVNGVCSNNMATHFDNAENAELFSGLIVSALGASVSVPATIYGYINNNYSALGMSRPLTDSEWDAIYQRFSGDYPAVKEAEHFDDFMLFLKDKLGSFCNHHGRFSMHLYDVIQGIDDRDLKQQAEERLKSSFDAYLRYAPGRELEAKNRVGYSMLGIAGADALFAAGEHVVVPKRLLSSVYHSATGSKKDQYRSALLKELRANPAFAKSLSTQVVLDLMSTAGPLTPKLAVEQLPDNAVVVREAYRQDPSTLGLVPPLVAINMLDDADERKVARILQAHPNDMVPARRAVEKNLALLKYVKPEIICGLISQAGPVTVEVALKHSVHDEVISRCIEVDYAELLRHVRDATPTNAHLEKIRRLPQHLSTCVIDEIVDKTGSAAFVLPEVVKDNIYYTRSITPTIAIKAYPDNLDVAVAACEKDPSVITQVDGSIRIRVMQACPETKSMCDYAAAIADALDSDPEAYTYLSTEDLVEHITERGPLTKKRVLEKLPEAQGRAVNAILSQSFSDESLYANKNTVLWLSKSCRDLEFLSRAIKAYPDEMDIIKAAVAVQPGLIAHVDKKLVSNLISRTGPVTVAVALQHPERESFIDRCIAVDGNDFLRYAPQEALSNLRVEEVRRRNGRLGFYSVEAIVNKTGKADWLLPDEIASNIFRRGPITPRIAVSTYPDNVDVALGACKCDPALISLVNIAIRAKVMQICPDTQKAGDYAEAIAWALESDPEAHTYLNVQDICEHITERGPLTLVVVKAKLPPVMARAVEVMATSNYSDQQLYTDRSTVLEMMFYCQKPEFLKYAIASYPADNGILHIGVDIDPSLSMHAEAELVRDYIRKAGPVTVAVALRHPNCEALAEKCIEVDSESFLTHVPADVLSAAHVNKIRAMNHHGELTRNQMAAIVEKTKSAALMSQKEVLKYMDSSGPITPALAIQAYPGDVDIAWKAVNMRPGGQQQQIHLIQQLPDDVVERIIQQQPKFYHFCSAAQKQNAVIAASAYRAQPTLSEHFDAITINNLAKASPQLREVAAHLKLGMLQSRMTAAIETYYDGHWYQSRGLWPKNEYIKRLESIKAGIIDKTLSDPVAVESALRSLLVAAYTDHAHRSFSVTKAFDEVSTRIFESLVGQESSAAMIGSLEGSRALDVATVADHGFFSRIFGWGEAKAVIEKAKNHFSQALSEETTKCAFPKATSKEDDSRAVAAPAASAGTSTESQVGDSLRNTGSSPSQNGTAPAYVSATSSERAANAASKRQSKRSEPRAQRAPTTNQTSRKIQG